MTQVDFYQLKSDKFDIMSMACALCTKAYQQNQKVLALTNNRQQTEKLDQLLWTQQENSFIPHDIEEQENIVSPVLIRHEADPRGERQILINLNQEIPVYFAQFERVIELISDENLEVARSHYRHYQERGYEIRHHKI